MVLTMLMLRRHSSIFLDASGFKEVPTCTLTGSSIHHCLMLHYLAASAIMSVIMLRYNTVSRRKLRRKAFIPSYRPQSTEGSQAGTQTILRTHTVLIILHQSFL